MDDTQYDVSTFIGENGLRLCDGATLFPETEEVSQLVRAQGSLLPRNDPASMVAARIRGAKLGIYRPEGFKLDGIFKDNPKVHRCFSRCWYFSPHGLSKDNPKVRMFMTLTTCNRALRDAWKLQRRVTVKVMSQRRDRFESRRLTFSDVTGGSA